MFLRIIRDVSSDHPYDRYFYDPVTKAYTVDRFLEDLKIRYGGIDSVLMWSVYTQIGVDDRNQFDMWRSMPGGLEGVANLTAQLHIHGVKMLWPNKPWDLGTRYEPAGRPGLSDTDAKVYATLLKQTDGDGLNGDTPASFADQPAWLENLKHDRKRTQKAIGWTGGVSDQVPWTLTSYIQAQAHPYDRYFYDPVTKAYTVDRFLEDLKIRYGGIDSVLMWSVYTQIGVDDRNQFDMWRSMPGGLEGVANLTAQLHIHGVKMLWPNKPWDLGTRYEPAGRPGLSDTDAKVYATLLKQTDGDGLNRDTMDSFSKEFYAESARLGHSIALEPENGVEDEALDWSTINWGYWSYPKAPVVDRFKFVTEGRFLTNVYNRWAKDKTNDLQSAWFNGDGYESWENVWGVWNGITHYDGEAICRVGTMLRYFGKEGFLASPDWEPYAREVWQADVYSSKFPLKERGQSVWTIVNRKNSYSWFSCTQLRLVLGTQLRLVFVPTATAGFRHTATAGFVPTATIGFRHTAAAASSSLALPQTTSSRPSLPPCASSPPGTWPVTTTPGSTCPRRWWRSL